MLLKESFEEIFVCEMKDASSAETEGLLCLCLEAQLFLIPDTCVPFPLKFVELNETQYNSV